MEIVDSFGEWLRRRRTALGLTRAELAQCCGCSVSALRKIEADERRPSRQLAELLAGCLHIAPDMQLAFVEAARGLRRTARLGSPSPLTESVSTDVIPHRPTWNVPSSLTPLLGREAELETLDGLLSDPNCRLLTLVGPGGIGKTRLAIEAAHRKQGHFADGIFFASLAAASSPEFIVPEIAQAVGLNFSGHDEPLTQLITYLKNKQALILLDNLEHLLQGVDQVVMLLTAAPRLKLLVTSRERLELQGEWVLMITGLPVPVDSQEGSVETYSAVQLFLQRAYQVQVNIELAAKDILHVGRICQLVEGMPLAIELAAAWVTMLSCREIAEEIERGLDILTTTLRDAPERQRSMRAVFNYSWELLTKEEQEALCQLSLFRGGFRREAAQAVAGANLSILTALVSKSLIRRRANGRYDLHEIIRQCALEHLQVNAELWSATKERFTAFYLVLVEAAEVQLKGSDQLQWLERLEQEHVNLRAVLEWSLVGDSTAEDYAAAPAMKLAAALQWFWQMRGHFHEGRDWLMKLLRR